MSWARRFWIASMGLFVVSFLSGTHLGEWHMYVSVPSMVVLLFGTGWLFCSKQESQRVRGSALTLFLVFFFASLLGWSVFVNTLPSLFHLVLMALFGVGAFFMTYELFWQDQKK